MDHVTIQFADDPKELHDRVRVGWDVLLDAQAETARRGQAATKALEERSSANGAKLKEAREKERAAQAAWKSVNPAFQPLTPESRLLPAPGSKEREIHDTYEECAADRRELEYTLNQGLKGLAVEETAASDRFADLERCKTLVEAVMSQLRMMYD